MNDFYQYQYGKQFSLKLGRNLNWQIFATEAAYGWLTQYAPILNLSTGVADDLSSRILVCSSRDRVESLPAIGKVKWLIYEYYGLRIRESLNSRDLIFEIFKEDTPEERIYNMWGTVHPLYKSILRTGGLPLHAGLAVHHGRAAAFAAPGGGGKSTTCSRLPNSWRLLGDDEMVIIPEEDETYTAHPFPTWSKFLMGKSERSWRVSQGYPLDHVYFLHKADQNSLETMAPYQGAAFLNQSSRQLMYRGWDLYSQEQAEEIKRLIIQNATTIAKQIHTYKLFLTLNRTLTDILF